MLTYGFFKGGFYITFFIAKIQEKVIGLLVYTKLLFFNDKGKVLIFIRLTDRPLILHKLLQNLAF